MAYATVDDLMKRWKYLNEDEQDRADTLLEDASNFINVEFRNSGKTIDEDDPVLSSSLKIVCCSIVKRMMASGTDQAVSQASQTAGSYTFQATFANPNGDMYMTDREYRMLGISRKGNKAGWSNPFMGEQ